MKKTILALAAAGLMPLAAGAQSTTPVPPAISAPPSSEVPGSSSTSPPGTRPAPTRFEPKMMYGDVARVLSSKPVYEKASAAPRECRMEGTGYNSAASELPPCDKTAQGSERIVAYDVTYQYMGRDFLIRMPYDPGEQMAVNVIVVPPAPPPSARSNYRIPNTRGPY